MTDSFRERVLRVVANIPEGKVTTYGRIAAQAGSPRSARVVGGILSRLPESHPWPCHRVVNREGMLSGGWAFGHPAVMRHLLLDEGIVFRSNGAVDLGRHLWDPEE